MYTLPTPIVTSGADASTPQPEYPSALAISDKVWLVADGRGAVYVLEIPAEGDAIVLGMLELSTASEQDADETNAGTQPFCLHAATIASENSTDVTALVSSARRRVVPPTENASKPDRSASVDFDLRAVRIPLSSPSATIPSKLETVWHGQGTDTPLYASYLPSHSSFLVLGSSGFAATAPKRSYEPTPEEIAPIPRAGGNLEDSAMAAPGPVRPPPYSWTQTTDSVTIAFPLPSTTPKGAVKVTIAPHSLSVSIDSAGSASGAPLPHYTARKWWDAARADTSYWTWERGEVGRTAGLLTLYVDKANEGTRWPQLFAAAAGSAGEEQVEETLDPSELAHIRDALEKYTADAAAGGGLGLGSGAPGLASGELDDAVDSSVGRQAFLTWIPVGQDGGAGSAEEQKTDDIPVQLLSLPVPGYDAPGAPPSVVTKAGLDGLLFSLSAADAKEWTHTSTYAVLSFVLASKQDTRFAVHARKRAVLAFESGARGRGANVYVYRGAGKEKWGKQAIVKVAEGTSGAVLGVGAVSVQGKKVLLCLCERELVVLRDLL